MCIKINIDELINLSIHVAYELPKEQADGRFILLRGMVKKTANEPDENATDEEIAASFFNSIPEFTRVFETAINEYKDPWSMAFNKGDSYEWALLENSIVLKSRIQALAIFNLAQEEVERQFDSGELDDCDDEECSGQVGSGGFGGGMALTPTLGGRIALIPVPPRRDRSKRLSP